ncbi:hypothetical protein KsCSTR_35180 [Candidatus Kuenenia stuttgartiensis]|uniref:Uncharacterized protein n=1 Tax=Kuenenia stuttgartiensis TaxID=174633 RepID=Q1Q6T4_KUEST|nr:hypothetical protein KsCSTR_35180 [Candidatus Kuenenia stuttgartiensis]CAJ73292.1 unknown protein [Candidatus Kuenenia stuttgartiensis]
MPQQNILSGTAIKPSRLNLLLQSMALMLIPFIFLSLSSPQDQRHRMTFFSHSV